MMRLRDWRIGIPAVLAVVVFVSQAGTLSTHGAPHSGRELTPEALERRVMATVDRIIAATVRIETEDGLGSGTMVSPTGAILTSAHVIEGCREITVTLADGRRYAASVTGINGAGDVALLDIDAERLVAAETGDPERLAAQDWVLAAGHPSSAFDDWQPTVSLGVVHSTSSSIDTDDRKKRFRNVIESDAPISPGSSGGGLWNVEGQLIGLNAAVTQWENRSFSVRITEFTKDRQRLEDGERFDRLPDPARSSRSKWTATRTDWFRDNFNAVKNDLGAKSVVFSQGDINQRGLVVSAQGDVVTAARPLRRVAIGSVISIRGEAGAGSGATLIGCDFENGVALLRLPERQAPYPHFLLPDGPLSPSRGALALSVVDNALIGGLVSAVRRTPPLSLTAETYMPDVIQVDLRFGRAGFGSPVASRDGALLGLVLQPRLEYSESRRQRVPYGAFVLPTEKVKESLALLRDGKGRPERGLGFLGAELRDLTEAQKAERGVDGGVVIGEGLSKQGPARRSGLEEGDVILAIDGTEVRSRSSAIARIVALQKGDRVEFTVLKHGERRQVMVEMGDRKDF